MWSLDPVVVGQHSANPPEYLSVAARLDMLRHRKCVACLSAMVIHQANAGHTSQLQRRGKVSVGDPY